jgi:CRISPR-associated protein Csm5
MSEFESANAACREGNILELYKFFHGNCVFEDLVYTIAYTNGFEETYNAIMKGKQTLEGDPGQKEEAGKEKDSSKNAGSVLEMYRTEGTPYPVIPGSSIKGAIRTALMNHFLKKLPPEDRESKLEELKEQKEKEERKEGDKFKKFEKDMKEKLFDYEDAKRDPLRAVLFSDCSFKAVKTQLVGKLDNVTSDSKEGKLKPKGMQIQAEVLRGTLLDGQAEAELCITINKELQKTPFSLKQEEEKKCIKEITFDDIHKSCNNFYWKEFEDEYDKFYVNINNESKDIIRKLNRKLMIASKTEGQFILRMGRWSQFEFVTFDEKFRVAKEDKEPTRTLFNYNGIYAPMGWCILEEKK